MQSFSANHSKMWSNRNADQFLAFRIGQPSAIRQVRNSLMEGAIPIITLLFL